ncbi:MAG: sigma-70 family RNA polymerase sigma factor [Clostridia bacterium]|nr:sigma-70 family RNA polymerase sigma factor [Clostridia bacterium]
MANIVVICGVNTSTLPKATAKELEELMLKLKSGDQDARNQFITLNMRLVLSIVQRFAIAKNNVDDVFQVGMVGLIKAIDNFDIKLGVKFSTYAVPMIIGEIRRYMRDSSSVKITRSLRDIAYLALQSKERLERLLPTEPTIEAISADIGIPIKDVACALEAITEPVSIYDSVYHDDDEGAMILDQIKDKTSEDKWIEEQMLKDAIKEVDSREREILYLRYYLGKTQMEISDQIGISQAQVSRLEKTAIKQIREFAK